MARMIDERMGKLENKKRPVNPIAQLKSKYRGDRPSDAALCVHVRQRHRLRLAWPRSSRRIFRVPVNERPITILELTGLPTEIVNVVVSVLCRMTFDFALWGEGHVPVTIVCEEAHRYVPAKSNTRLRAVPSARMAKIAKEGRKYGASLCIVTQRPAEIDPTILSQCNTVFALRMSNDRDQEIVQAAISDTGSGLLEFLPALGAREAIAFGDGVTLPVRIKFHELPKEFLPRSSTAKFSEKWQESTEDEAILELVVERWRSSGHVVDQDAHGDTESDVQEAAGQVNQAGAAAAAAGPAGGQRPVRAPAGHANGDGAANGLARRAMSASPQDAGAAAIGQLQPRLRRQPIADSAEGSPEGDGRGSLVRRAVRGETATPAAATGEPQQRSGGMLDLRARLRRKGAPAV